MLFSSSSLQFYDVVEIQSIIACYHMKYILTTNLNSIWCGNVQLHSAWLSIRLASVYYCYTHNVSIRVNWLWLSLIVKISIKPNYSQLHKCFSNTMLVKQTELLTINSLFPIVSYVFHSKMRLEIGIGKDCVGVTDISAFKLFWLYIPQKRYEIYRCGWDEMAEETMADPLDIMISCIRQS